MMKKIKRPMLVIVLAVTLAIVMLAVGIICAFAAPGDDEDKTIDESNSPIESVVTEDNDVPESRVENNSDALVPGQNDQSESEVVKADSADEITADIKEANTTIDEEKTADENNAPIETSGIGNSAFAPDPQVIESSCVITSVHDNNPKQNVEKSDAVDEKTEDVKKEEVTIDKEMTVESNKPIENVSIGDKNGVCDCDSCVENRTNATAYYRKVLPGDYEEGAIDKMIEDFKESNKTIHDIQTVYTGMESGLGLYGDGYIFWSMSSPPRGLYSINEWYPIEYMNRIDDEHIYVVYKVKGIDDDVWFMYVFFEKFDNKREYIAEGTETWWIYGRVFYVKEAWEYEDFSDITVGSLIPEEIDFDPNGRFATSSPERYYLLKDGILRIQFPEEKAPGLTGVKRASNYIEEIEFSESYEILSDFDGSTVCLRVDPNDLP